MILMFEKIINFLSQGIWRVRLRGLPRRKYYLFRTLRVVVLSLRNFDRNKCQLRASALTFYTLLSVVPVMAMAFGKGRPVQTIRGTTSIPNPNPTAPCKTLPSISQRPTRMSWRRSVNCRLPIADFQRIPKLRIHDQFDGKSKLKNRKSLSPPAAAAARSNIGKITTSPP